MLDLVSEEEAEVYHDAQDVRPTTSLQKVSDSVHTWPPCWDKKMWQNKKCEYPWLICSNEKLGCSVCHEVKSWLS